MQLERLYMQAVSTTFFQSFLLWFIAYFTLYINISDFANRFMGALTSLLVLAALLSSINSSLPQTAYFRHIDIWFFCFVINIVIIIFVHIFVDIFLNRENEHPVAPTGLTSMVKILDTKEKKKMSAVINLVAKIIIPVIIFLFLIVYFDVTIDH